MHPTKSFDQPFPPPMPPCPQDDCTHPPERHEWVLGEHRYVAFVVCHDGCSGDNAGRERIPCFQVFNARAVLLN